MHVFHRLRLGLTKNRLGRLLHSNRGNKLMYPKGWEPEVLKCLLEGNWNRPVWDVGAFVGRHAYLVSQKHPVYAFEPNLNALQFLGYNLKDCANVVIVPCALTLDGKPMRGTVDPDFLAPPTGPNVATLSVAEALEKFGRPGVIKIDIEGGEYELLKSELLIGIPLLIEWHREIPRESPHWAIQTIDETHSLLMPRKGLNPA
jgi:FkbM family methyltransferase